LHRPGAGQSLEVFEVGVEKDARVADDGDCHVARVDASSLFGPGRDAFLLIAGPQRERAHSPFPGHDQADERDQHEPRDPAPRLYGYRPLGNRLCDAGAMWQTCRTKCRPAG